MIVYPFSLSRLVIVIVSRPLAYMRPWAASVDQSEAVLGRAGR